MSDIDHIKYEDLTQDAKEILEYTKQFAIQNYNFNFDPQQWIDKIRQNRIDEINEKKQWIIMLHDLSESVIKHSEHEYRLMDKFIWDIPDMIRKKEQWLIDNEHTPLLDIVYKKINGLKSIKNRLENKDQG